jgi:hypothetical protein
MKKITATCETQTCSQKGIKHQFESDILFTVCGVCSQEITDLVIEEIAEVTDGSETA